MAVRDWLVLIHQIPPRPLYLRAKIRQRLTKVGAVSLKNSVYVLPAADETIEDFQWIAQEITAGGGQAFICSGEFLAGVSTDDLIAQIHAARAEDYGVLRTSIDAASEASALARHRARLEEISRIDFFDSPIGKEVEVMLQRAEAKARQANAREQRGGKRHTAKARTWVTRRGIKIDRLASAWLIKRFIDPRARFRFVDPKTWKRKTGELAFDMVGGDYTHEGDRCTFETLLSAFTPKEPGLRTIAQIVHDLDLKDRKYGRAEAPGVQQLIDGIVAGHPRDEARLERGLALFDDLRRAYQRKPR